MATHASQLALQPATRRSARLRSTSVRACPCCVEKPCCPRPQGGGPRPAHSQSAHVGLDASALVPREPQHAILLPWEWGRGAVLDAEAVAGIFAAETRLQWFAHLEEAQCHQQLDDPEIAATLASTLFAGIARRWVSEAVAGPGPRNFRLSGGRFTVYTAAGAWAEKSLDAAAHELLSEAANAASLFALSDERQKLPLGVQGAVIGACLAFALSPHLCSRAAIAIAEALIASG